MQKITFFSLIASTCTFYRYFDTHKAGSWTDWTNTLTEFKREGEAFEERQSSDTAQLPGRGAASPSKEQCCQTLPDPRLSKCPEPNERSWCILRLSDKQSSESLGIIIFLRVGWSFAEDQQLDPPDLSFFACWLPKQTCARLPELLLLWLFINNLSSNTLFLVSVIFSTAVVTEALSNGKGELNRTEVNQPLQSLEAKDSPVIKNFNISDRHGRYTRVWNLFLLRQFVYSEINFNT